MQKTLGKCCIHHARVGHGHMVHHWILLESLSPPANQDLSLAAAKDQVRGCDLRVDHHRGGDVPRSNRLATIYPKTIHPAPIRGDIHWNDNDGGIQREPIPQHCQTAMQPVQSELQNDVE